MGVRAFGALRLRGMWISLRGALLEAHACGSGGGQCVRGPKGGKCGGLDRNKFGDMHSWAGLWELCHSLCNLGAKSCVLSSAK